MSVKAGKKLRINIASSFFFSTACGRCLFACTGYREFSVLRDDGVMMAGFFLFFFA